MKSSNALETATGVTCATFPTSSSACIIRLIRATGNLVFISILRGLGFLSGFEEDGSCDVEGSDLIRGPREDMVGEEMYWSYCKERWELSEEGVRYCGCVLAP